jgi:hypothetical protein
LSAGEAGHFTSIGGMLKDKNNLFVCTSHGRSSSEGSAMTGDNFETNFTIYCTLFTARRPATAWQGGTL